METLETSGRTHLSHTTLVEKGWIRRLKKRTITLSFLYFQFKGSDKDIACLVSSTGILRTLNVKRSIKLPEPRTYSRSLIRDLPALGSETIAFCWTLVCWCATLWICIACTHGFLLCSVKWFYPWIFFLWICSREKYYICTKLIVKFL